MKKDKIIECDECYATTITEKIYKYNEKFYCSNCLLQKIEDEESDFTTSLTTAYYIGGEYIGSDDETSESEVVQSLIDYGYEIEEV